MRLRNLSVQRKLVCATLAITLAALVIASAGFLICDLITFRRLQRDDLITQAQIIASNSTAALSFQDKAAAAEILSALQAKDSIRAAAVYGRDGELFARYAAPGSQGRSLPPRAGQPGYRLRGNRVEVFQEITLAGDKLGSLYLQSDLHEWELHFQRYSAIIALLMLGSALAAIPLSSRLMRLISEPILHLAETMRTVSREKNYSLRARKSGEDEIGAVIDGFNLMLGEIEARDAELQTANEELETRVRKRTEELENEVDERRRAEVDLAEARDRALEAARVKSEFLANMSHEIRTPMNGIIGMTELALDTELTTEQREYLETVCTSADSLLTIINDILDFSKIEARKLQLSLVEFDLEESLSDTFRSLAVRADQKGLELAYYIAPDVPTALIGDPDRLRQILVNLCGNAIKFTEKGELVAHVEIEKVAPEAIRLHFSVRDTGIGIPLEKQAMIFRAFTQADSSTTRQFGGTGLGLSIASQLVALMGGSIWVESEAGKGSIFHFTALFGRGSVATVPTPRMHLEALRGVRVLVVDDNATNRGILRRMLSNWGMLPTTVDGGAEALDVLLQGKLSGQPFSLVLLDVMMPEMDGFTLAERISVNPGLAGATVVMLSSARHQGDVERCHALGIAAYLTKPIKQSDLLDALLATLGDPRRPATDVSLNSSPRITPASQSLHMLLAEDNAVNQKLAVRLLEKRGHTVVVAGNGREAVAALERERFDIVLMDVQMPEMNGFEATAAIRKRDAQMGTHTPVIAMTAHAMKGDRERCLEAGMDNYVTKPLNVEELFRVIESLAVPSLGDREAPAPIQTEPLDAEALLAELDGDQELRRELAEIFLAELPLKLEAICDAIAHVDGRALERAAHALKGALGCLRARPAAEAVYRLEAMGREGDLAGASSALSMLRRELDRLEPVLTELSPGMINGRRLVVPTTAEGVVVPLIG
jgi:signal transduction histidine kinase/CheY-like chemotaxis protein